MSSNIVESLKKYVSGSHRFITVGSGSTSVPPDTLVTLSKLTAMTIENGNVGIGTTIPIKKLDVNGDINFNGSLYQNNALYVSSQWTSNNVANTLYYNDGNVAIGKSLTVEGTITTSNLVVLNAYSTDYQIAPIRKVTYVDPGPSSSFTLTTNGYFGGVASNVHVFVDNNKLTYYSDTINDYQLAVAYDYGNDKTNYTVTLTNPAVFGNLVDITIWPKILQETLPNPMRLYQYVNIEYTTPINAPLQVTPVRKVFYVESASQSVFDVITPGVYGGEASNVQVFVGQSLLSYYSSTISDYTLGITYNGNNTIYTVTLTNPVEYANLVDITIWPTVISGSNMIGSIYQNVTTTSQWQPGSGSDIYYYTTGNVGIGTTNPTTKLHVVGNVLATGTITASNISVLGDFVTLNTITSNTEQMVITNAGTGPALKVTQTGDNSVAEFYDNESGIALFVGNNGNVGVGTTSPMAKLDVQGGTIISGNVGIGTTIATSMLTINGQTTVNTNTPSVTWISGHSNYNYTIAGNSYNTSNNGSSLSIYAPMVIINNGDLYIWGTNTYGQLNSGSSDTAIVQATPIKNNYGSLANKKLVAVSGGQYHSAALDDNGELHMWGNNWYGQLGIGTYSPTALVAPPSGGISAACNISSYGSLSGRKIIGVSCSDVSTLALDSIGEVHAWGTNVNGVLGLGSNIPNFVSVACNISSYGSLKGKTIVAIGCMQSASISTRNMALDNTGQVHMWGYNPLGGILGFGSANPGYVTTACNISVYGSLNGRIITNIACGVAHSIALDSTGQVHTWGYNNNGQIGTGSTIDVTRACNISSYGSLNGKTIVAVNAGYFSSYALDSFGKVHAWGANNLGQLGNGTTSNQLIPINISDNGSLYGQTLTTLSSENYGITGLDIKGSIHKWGYGYNGINNTISQEVLPLNIATFRKNKLYLSDNTINFDGAKISSDNSLSGIAISTSSSNNVVVINNNGNVGIGTTNPQAKLHVNGFISTPNNIYVSAWCKTGDGDFRVAVDTVVPWNQVYLNVGNCLNTTTGVFTASVKGYYFVSWNGLLDMTASAGGLRLEKNEVMVKGMVPWKDLTHSWINIGASTIQQLNIGDRLQVRCVSSRMFSGNDNGHNSFVVYLLSAIP